LQTEQAPPVLKDFFPHNLDELRSINEEEGRNYPAPPIPSILSNPQLVITSTMQDPYTYHEMIRTMTDTTF